jgi:soluble P-type ATPase
LRVAVILDKSGTIIKAHRILCEVKTGSCFPCNSTLRFVSEKRETLVNVMGRMGDIQMGNIRLINLKVSCSPNGQRGKIPIETLAQPGVIECLKKATNQVVEDCRKGLGVCAGLLIDSEGKVTHAVALGGEIYGDVPKAVSTIISGGDDVFLATGNCRSFSIRCARSLGIPKEFVLYDADPGEKMELVRRLKSYYGLVIMVGNDINDIVAMAEADLGVLIKRPDTPSTGGLERRVEVDYVLDSMAGVCEIVRKVKEPLSRNIGRDTRNACGGAP